MECSSYRHILYEKCSLRLYAQSLCDHEGQAWQSLADCRWKCYAAKLGRPYKKRPEDWDVRFLRSYVCGTKTFDKSQTISHSRPLERLTSPEKWSDDGIYLWYLRPTFIFSCIALSQAFSGKASGELAVVMSALLAILCNFHCGMCGVVSGCTSYFMARVIWPAP